MKEKFNETSNKIILLYFWGKISHYSNFWDDIAPKTDLLATLFSDWMTIALIRLETGGIWKMSITFLANHR